MITFFPCLIDLLIYERMNRRVRKRERRKPCGKFTGSHFTMTYSDSGLTVYLFIHYQIQLPSLFILFSAIRQIINCVRERFLTANTKLFLTFVSISYVLYDRYLLFYILFNKSCLSLVFNGIICIYN